MDIRYNLVPVTRIEFRRIKGRGDGQQKDNYETVLGVFRFFFNTTRTRVRSRYRPPSAGVHSDQMGWTRPPPEIATVAKPQSLALAHHNLGIRSQILL